MAIIIEDLDATVSAHPKLQVIRKLLAKATANGTTEPEREALNAKVMELCAKYGIERAALAASGGQADEMVIKEYTVYEEYARQQGELLYWIMEALGCQGVMTHGDAEFDSVGVQIVGYLADIQRGEVLYTSLALQMAAGCVRDIPATSRSNERRSWMGGFIVTVKYRIVAAERKAGREADPAGTGTALVLASRRDQVVAAYRQEFPNVGRGRSRSYNPAAAAAGAAAGRRANLGGTSVGGGRRALAGQR